MSPQYNDWGYDLGMGLASLGQGLTQLEENIRKKNATKLEYLIQSSGGDYQEAARRAQGDKNLAKSWRMIFGEDPDPAKVQIPFEEQQKRQSAQWQRQAYEELRPQFGDTMAWAITQNPNLMMNWSHIMALPPEQRLEAFQNLAGKANLQTYAKMADLGYLVDPQTLAQMGIRYPNQIPTPEGVQQLGESVTQMATNPMAGMAGLPAALEGVKNLFNAPELPRGTRAALYETRKEQGEVRAEQKDKEIDIKRQAEERRRTESATKQELQKSQIDLNKARAERLRIVDSDKSKIGTVEKQRGMKVGELKYYLDPYMTRWESAAKLNTEIKANPRATQQQRDIAQAAEDAAWDEYTKKRIEVGLTADVKTEPKPEASKEQKGFWKKK